MNTDAEGGAADTDDREPGPPRLAEILDDLREADPAVPIEPSYQSSSTDAEAVTARAVTDHASVTVRREAAEELGLDAELIAFLAVGDHSSVTLAVEADAPDGDASTSTAVDLTPTAARQVAIQLLASAAVADDHVDGPPGYLAE